MKGGCLSSLVPKSVKTKRGMESLGILGEYFLFLLLVIILFEFNKHTLSFVNVKVFTLSSVN